MRLVLIGLVVALGLCSALTSAAPETAAAGRPNFVFILVDDLRWNALACYGHPFAKTPNIDRLANEGALFKNAFVTTPLCSPSRASFLTGQYVHQHGVKGNGNQYSGLSHQLVTFPKRLHDAGYETAYVGKWHMGNDDAPRPGFDRWVSFRGQGAHVDPQLNVDGKSLRVQGYTTDILTDYSVEFLKKERRPEKAPPYCLYLAYKAVHGPFVPAPRHQDLYSQEPVARAPSAQDTNEGKPALIRPVGNTRPPGPGTGSGDPLIRNQLRMLAAIDEGVGRLLKTLEEAKQLDRTLVIFTSDNGFFWGEHGLSDKRWAYEESIRVPLLMRHPGLIRAGTTIEGMAVNVDVAPTLLALGGVAKAEGVQGRSLLPLLKGDAAGWRRAALFEYFQEPGFPRAPTWQAVRTERWKYARYPELEGMDELYDLKADPYEMKNLIREPAAAPALKELQAELERLLAAHVL